MFITEYPPVKFIIHKHDIGEWHAGNIDMQNNREVENPEGFTVDGISDSSSNFPGVILPVWGLPSNSKTTALPSKSTPGFLVVMLKPMDLKVSA
mmetsp:Transcript_3467/g.3958  ORF Transcript_3467/g.3958 Transcript_3467/m.3958 type:complete len:94 (+) Transcript_3467:88-369(+)